ncbi:3-hydroxyacyl-CoA dehydrogenase family protein [Rhodococcus opacus]|uniref:3-hydroxyacyl-CoA dehydrogenase n=2 Tax=Rhodococcus TaxID=1827 RepID=A0A076F046_RHOOP|nr:3-hydroxyacyl-CoA dehydrogenase family protein [Rhodococcus opacus]ACL31228.1 3-hydroxyacyl-CoA dehydrogenase [Rhodococcus sp. TFB]AII11053.1 3-hydroxyacyl-CoA dehydrogenase [Rhodococcus opacus]
MKVLVVGAGAMGSQVGMVVALAGLEAVVCDVSVQALASAEASLRQRLAGQVANGRRTQEAVDGAFARLRFESNLEFAAADADLVIEAIVEKVDAKRALFAELGRLTQPHAILTSNSSSIVPSKLADASGRPDRFVNIHFFNPALVMKAAEVVRGPETSDATMKSAVDFVERIGKTPIALDKEIFGFVANRLLNAVRDEAIRLYEDGYASVQAIDTAAKAALGYPMGPFELMDLTGIDIGYHVKKERYAETGDPADLPSRSVTELVESGHLGRKTGRGWYTYDKTGT